MAQEGFWDDPAAAQVLIGKPFQSILQWIEEIEPSLLFLARHGSHRIEGPDLAQAQYDTATNMTDEIAAFAALLEAGDTAIAARFHDRWKDDRLVMDKWFMAQVAHAAPEAAVATAEALTRHPLFDWTNPNRFRSVIAGLTAQNPAGFHDPSGAGYRFLADWLIRLDAKNPQTAARMSTAFETWARYDADRQQLIRGELDRIAARDGLSRDLSDMVDRIRAD